MVGDGESVTSFLPQLPRPDHFTSPRPLRQDFTSLAIIYSLFSRVDGVEVFVHAFVAYIQTTVQTIVKDDDDMVQRALAPPIPTLPTPSLTPLRLASNPAGTSQPKCCQVSRPSDAAQSRARQRCGILGASGHGSGSVSVHGGQGRVPDVLPPDANETTVVPSSN